MASGYACALARVGRSFRPGAVGAVPDCRPESAVLRAAHRMRRSRDFARVVREGRRAGRPRLVIHCLVGSVDEPTQVGLVVSKQVGNSVVRHRVARRLRGVLAERLERWPTGRLIVVRALPLAATGSSAEFAADLDRAWERVTEKEAR